MSNNSVQKWFSLEEHFFHELDQRLLKELRDEMATQATAAAIMKITGVTDTKLAEKIAELGVGGETLTAFRLVPFVATAWADDRVEENERYTLMKAAKESGLEEDSTAMKLLGGWTKRRPSSDLLDVWCEYAKTLSQALSEPHRVALKSEVMAQVKAVSEASGGLLGFGSVSPSEQSVMKKVEAALS